MAPLRTAARAAIRVYGKNVLLQPFLKGLAARFHEPCSRTLMTTSRLLKGPTAKSWGAKSQASQPKPKQRKPPPPISHDESGKSQRAEEPKDAELPGDKRQSLAELVVQRRAPFFGLLIAAGLLSGYASYLFVIFINTSPPCSNPNCAHGTENADGSPAFRESEAPTGLPASLTRVTAREFDASLDWPEWLMGYTRHRRRLAASAEGHVLEVAVGTGRNFDFYDWDDLADMDPTKRALRQMEKARYRGRRPSASAAPSSGSDAFPAEAHCSPEITSFTGVDISGDVLEVSRNKVRDVLPNAKEKIKKRRRVAWGTGPVDEEGRVTILDAYDGRMRLFKSDAQTQALPPPPPISSKQEPPPAAFVAAQAAAAAKAGKSPSPSPPPTFSGPADTLATAPTKYDTILQTFGLCSVADPSAHLRNLASAIRPGSGRVLLMEHGRGRWGFVNNFLDQYAGRHFERFGCWWNRDVEKLVRQAAAEVPGLEVVRIKRPGLLQGGTLMLIELKMNQVVEAEKKEVSKKADQKSRSWWGFGTPRSAPTPSAP